MSDSAARGAKSSSPDKLRLAGAAVKVGAPGRGAWKVDIPLHQRRRGRATGGATQGRDGGRGGKRWCWGIGVRCVRRFSVPGASRGGEDRRHERRRALPYKNSGRIATKSLSGSHPHCTHHPHPAPPALHHPALCSHQVDHAMLPYRAIRAQTIYISAASSHAIRPSRKPFTPFTASP